MGKRGLRSSGKRGLGASGQLGLPAASKKAKAAPACPEAAKGKGRPTQAPLAAVVHHWGTSGWALGADGEELWQVQVLHRDGPGFKGSFRWQVITTCQQALQNHPNPEITDLKSLRKVGKVQILCTMPSQWTEDYDPDPDRMNFQLWEPVLYAAGPTPYEALKIIGLVLRAKIDLGYLSQMPPKMEVQWALGAPPRQPLPRPWVLMRDGSLDLANPFEVLPPTGRRHVLASLRAQKADPNFYDLHFVGGLYHFKGAFEEAGLRPHPVTGYLRRTKPDWVYVLPGLQCMDEDKLSVQKILTQVLQGIPVYLSNEVENAEDRFASWLLEQPTIVLNKGSHIYSFCGSPCF